MCIQNAFLQDSQQKSLSAVAEGQEPVKKARPEATLEFRDCEGFNLLASPLLETGKDWGRAVAAPHGTETKISSCFYVLGCS